MDIDLSNLFFDDISKLPKTLYHYTSIPVLIEIMKPSAFLYATHYSFLNDGAEIFYGQQMFDQILQRKYFDLYTRYHGEIEKDNFIDPICFISSFSEERDDLGQWRAYTDSYEGGVSIGFDTKSIINEISYDIFYKSKIPLSKKIVEFFHDAKPINILQCQYNEQVIEKNLEKNLRWILKQYNNCKKMTNQSNKNIIEKALCGNLIDLRLLTASYAKNPSFFQEHEYRVVKFAKITEKNIIVLGEKPRIKAFRINHKKMIKSITVSPHGKRQRNINLAKVLCEMMNLPTDIISTSKSSYIG